MLQNQNRKFVIKCKACGSEQDVFFNTLFTTFAGFMVKNKLFIVCKNCKEKEEIVLDKKFNDPDLMKKISLSSKESDSFNV